MHHHEKLVQGVGFEPTKALPPELKSGPFDHSGTPACLPTRVTDLNQPAGPQNMHSNCPDRENTLTDDYRPSYMLSRLKDHGWSKTPVLTVVVVLLLQVGTAPIVSLDDANDSRMDAPASNQVETYSLYLSQGNNLSTVLPTSGGQLEASALDTNVEFSTNDLLQPLQVVGSKRQTSDGTSQYYVQLNVFLKAEGPQNAAVTWTFSIISSGSTVASGEREHEACSGGFGTQCDFDHETVDIFLDGGSDSFTAPESGELILRIRAEMSGCGDGFFDDCDAKVAFNQISGDSRSSLLDISTNAVSDTVFYVQRPGDEFIDGSVTDWYPNDIIDDREMQFSFDVKSAFGRKDIESVELRLRYAETNGIILQKDLEPVSQKIEWTTEGLFGRHKWTYQSGLESGDYEAELRITDVQSNVFVITHETLSMHEFGVSLKHSDERSVEYIAPGAITPVPLQLIHRGDATLSMNVDLQLLTTLGSDWLVEFDSPGGYSMNSGGTILSPIMTITAPLDLSDAPSEIRIRAIGEAEVGGVFESVSDTLELDLEKLQVYQPPVVAVWDEEMETLIANSSISQIDSTVPRYVEDGEFNPFIMEVFNTGFTSDSFRIDVLERSKAIIQVYDNDTGQRILEDDDDGTFHTDALDRHNTQTVRLAIKPSGDRSDPDTGTIRLEVASMNNSSLKTIVEFTIQRTFGIRAEISQDCDGVPLGFIETDDCTSTSMRVRITNSLSENSGIASSWLIINPASLSENTDRNQAYGIWSYNIIDSSGANAPKVTLGPGDFVELFMTIEMTSQVIEGNHTIYLRVMEDVSADEEDARYFDLAVTLNVKADDPLLELVQVTSNRGLSPGDEYAYQIKVKNKGNSPQTVLLSAGVDEQGWSVDVEGPSGSPLVEIGPFEEVTFRIRVSAPSDANNGDRVPVLVKASPFATDQAWPEEFTAELSLMMVVDISSIIDLLVNEITHPRGSTWIVLGVAVLLVFAGFQSRLSRQRVAAQMALLDALSNEMQAEPSVEVESAPTIEIPDEDAFDDDIELV